MDMQWMAYAADDESTLAHPIAWSQINPSGTRVAVFFSHILYFCHGNWSGNHEDWIKFIVWAQKTFDEGALLLTNAQHAESLPRRPFPNWVREITNDADLGSWIFYSLVSNDHDIELFRSESSKKVKRVGSKQIFRSKRSLQLNLRKSLWSKHLFGIGLEPI